MKPIRGIQASAYLIAALVFILDQLSKAWVLGRFHSLGGYSIPVWGPLRLTLVQNGGVSFGLLQGGSASGRWALSAFSLAVFLVLAAWVRRLERLITIIAVGMIMGGAVGNLVDRVRLGSVMDFVDLQQLFFPWVFNLADSAISVGIALLLVENLFFPRAAEP